MRGENTTESGLFTLYMRYIESIHAIFVKEQNNLLVFPLSYQTFFLFLGQQSKRDKEHINTITPNCNPFTISYVAMCKCNYIILSHVVAKPSSC